MPYKTTHLPSGPYRVVLLNSQNHIFICHIPGIKRISHIMVYECYVHLGNPMCAFHAIIARFRHSKSLKFLGGDASSRYPSNIYKILGRPTINQGSDYVALYNSPHPESMKPRNYWQSGNNAPFNIILKLLLLNYRMLFLLYLLVNIYDLVAMVPGD